MNISTSAEFYLIHENLVPKIALEADLKKEVISKWWGLKKEIKFKDTYDEFLKNNGQKVEEFATNGFLLINDALQFLIQKKKIQLDEKIYKDVVDKLAEREELALFISSSFAKNISEQVAQCHFNDDELRSYNTELIGFEDEVAIPFQKEQLLRICKVIQSIPVGQVLYIRGELG